MPSRKGRILILVSALVAAVLLLLALQRGYEFERELWLLRGAGWTALAALLLTLSMSALARAFEYLGRSPVGVLELRRLFGIGCALWALAHATIALSTYLRGSWIALFSTPYLRGGFTAVVILTILLGTSFPKFTRRLRIRLWKQLHRLVYLAAVLVFQHLILSPFAPRRIVLTLAATVLLLQGLRFLPRSKSQHKGSRPTA